MRLCTHKTHYKGITHEEWAQEWQQLPHSVGWYSVCFFRIFIVIVQLSASGTEVEWMYGERKKRRRIWIESIGTICTQRIQDQDKWTNNAWALVASLPGALLQCKYCMRIAFGDMHTYTYIHTHTSSLRVKMNEQRARGSYQMVALMLFSYICWTLCRIINATFTTYLLLPSATTVYGCLKCAFELWPMCVMCVYVNRVFHTTVTSAIIVVVVITVALYRT